MARLAFCYNCPRRSVSPPPPATAQLAEGSSCVFKGRAEPRKKKSTGETKGERVSSREGWRTKNLPEATEDGGSHSTLCPSSVGPWVWAVDGATHRHALGLDLSLLSTPP